MIPMHKNASVDVHQFAMIPKADIPRSTFDRQWTTKTTFDAGYLIPIYIDEVLPGDSFNLKMTAFCRLSTPLFPVMDNMHLDTFFFFVPNRLVWTNWVKMMGEQNAPGDSISYTTPQMVTNVAGWAVGSLGDYFGLPTVGQLGGAATYSHSALPFRAWGLIYNQWFRDENIDSGYVVATGDGPDLYTAYPMVRRGKRKDYFTSALPWPQKGATAVSLPLGTTATVRTQTTELVTGAQAGMKLRGGAAGAFPAANTQLNWATADGTLYGDSTAPGGVTTALAYPTNLYADLSTATAATINQLRQSFQIQKLLERDARGGTRYTEIVRSHFGVVSPDARLQRPEYLGGGSTPIIINPIAQTTQTGLTGGSTPLGTLGGVGTAIARNHGFTQAFTEHGHIIGIANVRADLTYQQGVRRFWNRATRYDYYMPVFAMLGEQSILNQEIYAVGNGATGDTLVFGYQERWSELRYFPSLITGLFRSTSAGTIDPWHLAQKFTALPTLNSTFISDTPPVSRVVAVGAAANGQQFIFDSIFSCRTARPLPMYSVPGLIDHF